MIGREIEGVFIVVVVLFLLLMFFELFTETIYSYHYTYEKEQGEKVQAYCTSFDSGLTSGDIRGYIAAHRKEKVVILMFEKGRSKRVLVVPWEKRAVGSFDVQF